MNITIGTAQFSKNYGLLKKKSYPKQIIKFINSSNKIKMIDTAPTYGQAEKILGKYLKKKIKITTKISPFLYESVDKNLDKFKFEFERSLKNLQVENIYGLLFHKDLDIRKTNHGKFFNYLDSLKKQKLINKIGFSTYSTKYIKKNLNIYNFKIIQLPINIFNFNKNYFNFLKNLKKKYNVEIHARSIFLQGLGFLNKIKNAKFINLNRKLELLTELSKTKEISKFQLMLMGIYNPSLINTYIIGANSLKEINELYKINNSKILNSKISFKKFIINDNIILDPRKWPKNIQKF